MVGRAGMGHFLRRWATSTRDYSGASRPQHHYQPAAKTGARLEILRHLALGKTNGEIAGSLHFSESYVRLLLQEAEHKLGVANRAQAAARAVELGLLRRSEGTEEQ